MAAERLLPGGYGLAAGDIFAGGVISSKSTKKPLAAVFSRLFVSATMVALLRKLSLFMEKSVPEIARENFFIVQKIMAAGEFPPKGASKATPKNRPNPPAWGKKGLSQRVESSGGNFILQGGE